jgi:putative phosphoribosyl transferase
VGAKFQAAVLDERLAAILGVAADELHVMKARALVQAREREDLYRGDKPLRDLHGKTVVVVDDGLATGATMRVAVKAIRALGSSRIVVAVPVSAPDTAASMAAEDGVDEFHCLATPESFFAVGEWYEDFSPVTDSEVSALLAHGSMRAPFPPGARATRLPSSRGTGDPGKEVPR